MEAQGRGALSRAPSIRITFQDVLDRRAYIRIGPEARIRLCHRAGAPWNDKAPDAELHDLQQEVLRRRERQKIVHGGSRLGKSVLGGCEGVVEAMIPFSKLAVIAQRYDHVGAEWQYVHRGLKTLFEGKPQAFKRLTFKHQANYHDYDFETLWGSRGRGYSVESDEGAALLGQEFSRMILGEGSHISHNIYERRILRAADGWLMQSKQGAFREGGYISIYTTPKQDYEGCSAAEWERIQKQTKRQPETLHYGNVPFAESYWIREADVLENPYYDRKVYEARKRSMSKDAFEEQYGGKMTFRTGRVLKSFTEDRHLVAHPTSKQIQKMRLGVGIDPGTYKGIVFAGIDRSHRLWALGEVYTQQQTFVDTCHDLREAFVNFMAPVRGYPMPVDEEGYRKAFDELQESVDVWVIDPAAQDKIDWMSELDVTLSTPVGMEGGKLELLPSVERMDDWFKLGRAVVSEECDILPDQIRKYVWKQRKAPTRGAAKAPVIVEPRKEYDHLIDACRFVWTMLAQMGPTDEAPSPVSIHEAWEQAQKERLFGPLKADLAEARARDEGMMWQP